LITWESLDFQPYFTANASNIGYGWWSHDIGGHMMGYKNDEMEARWAQFGVYSPIMRLHSSFSEFNGKEPWRFKKETELAMGDSLRHRHRMIPYLYSMNYRSYKEDLPIIEPMYYEYPEEREAYQVKNQYYFGSELLVAPITTPRIPGLNVAGVKVWLPEGTWYDICTGMIYEGGRSLNMYRDLNSIPVLAKAGGILPFTEEILASEAARNPASLKVYVYAGADGKFTLYEDDNESVAYESGDCVKTLFTYEEGERAVFTIEPAEGNLELIPGEREFTVVAAGFLEEAANLVAVTVDGQFLPGEKLEISYEKEKQAVTVEIPNVGTGQRVQVFLPMEHRAKGNLVEERVFAFLNQAEIEFMQKDAVFQAVKKEPRVCVLLAQLHAMGLEKEFYEALAEILTAAGADKTSA
ncbi:MAG: DUF5110 domain-containing protein, partial [Kineothrix sp.]|nr:DUF5110 domain-containing protein [Kineothrix sp.]